jgi:phosphoribosylaminoimidazole-succinocarboxamide synthase
MINESHMVALKLASKSEVKQMVEAILKANDVLSRFLESKGIALLDFKLEFGRGEGGMLIGDELDPDCMRVRDSSTGKVLDKDLYRKGASLEEVKRAYEEFYRRISKE